MNIAFAIVVLLLLALGYSIGPGVASAAASSGDGEQAPTQNTTNDTGIMGYASDNSLTGAPITNDPATWPGDAPGSAADRIWTICQAVARAEGYQNGPGCAPYDLNNPGDLSPGDEAGQLTAGGAQVHDGSAIVFFATAEGGWNALYNKFANIVRGASKVYPASWTWAQVAAKYAGNSANWLANVTGWLGVDPQSTPAQYVNGK